jgi:hypothetical protein
MSESNDLATRIAQATGIQPEKLREVVQLALEELHRITIVDEKGPTAAVIETCFSFGDEAAFHLIGLFASEHAYHGRDDDAGMWSEVARRFIPTAYAEGCDRIAPWFAEKAAGRLGLDADIRNRPMSISKHGGRDTDSSRSDEQHLAVMSDEPSPFDTLQVWEHHLAELRLLPESTLLRDEMIAHAERSIADKRRDRPFPPASKLVMGRTMLMMGRKHDDLGLARQGQRLIDEANAELARRRAGESQPKVPHQPTDAGCSATKASRPIS